MKGKKTTRPIKMPVLDPKVIGRRIRRTRKMYQHSLYDLERISGIPRMTIACYECGVRLPRFRNMVRLAIALRRTMDFLALGRRDARTRKIVADAGGSGGETLPGNPARPPVRDCEA